MRQASTASLAALCLFTAACVSSTVRYSSDGYTSHTDPDYEDHFDQYALGFVGEGEVSLQTACMDEKPKAFEVLKSSTDVMITLLTAGIYSPITARVWCGP